MMRFLDSNVFLHAFLAPHRTLTNEEQRVKDEAKVIIKSVEGGEEVAMSTAHLSEVVNIVEARLGLQKSLGLLTWAISSENITIYPVALEDYGGTLLLAKENNISANDALAYLCMKKQGIREVYSFDKHFGQFKDIVRLPTI
jgi:hypothetical protein